MAELAEIATVVACPTACVMLALTLAIPGARAQKPKELEWSHAFDLAVRKLGEAEFSDGTVLTVDHLFPCTPKR